MGRSTKIKRRGNREKKVLRENVHRERVVRGNVYDSSGVGGEGGGGGSLRKRNHDELFQRELLNCSLLNLMLNKSIKQPWPLQKVTIPLITRRKDVVVRAKMGSGKTTTHLVSMVAMLEGFFYDPERLIWDTVGPTTVAMFMLPTLELCQQTYNELAYFLKAFIVTPKVALLKSPMDSSQIDALVPSWPDIIISTPDCVESLLKKGFDRTCGNGYQRSLTMLILDEVDLLLSSGYESALKSIMLHVPKTCQCLIFSDNPSANVEDFKSFVLHHPFIVTLPEVGDVMVEVFPYNVVQFYMTCKEDDKLLHFFYLLYEGRIRKKALIFTHSIHMAEKLVAYIEMFDLRPEVVYPGLSDDVLSQTVKVFSAGGYGACDMLVIASDCTDGSDVYKWESGVVEQIFLDEVDYVVNYDMPNSAEGYARRVDRTGRAQNVGVAISLVCPKEEGFLDEIRLRLGGDKEDSQIIAPCNQWLKEAMFENGGILRAMRWGAKYGFHGRHDVLDDWYYDGFKVK